MTSGPQVRRFIVATDDGNPIADGCAWPDGLYVLRTIHESAFSIYPGGVQDLPEVVWNCLRWVDTEQEQPR